MRKLNHEEIWGLTQGRIMKLEVEHQRIWLFLPLCNYCLSLCVTPPDLKHMLLLEVLKKYRKRGLGCLTPNSSFSNIMEFLLSCFSFLEVHDLFCLLCVLSHFSCVWLFATLLTASPPGSSVHGFSRQEYWNGLPCPPLGDLPNPGIEPVSLMSHTLGSLSVAPPGKPKY